jgi:hypothetical protein
MAFFIAKTKLLKAKFLRNYYFKLRLRKKNLLKIEIL